MSEQFTPAPEPVAAQSVNQTEPQQTTSEPTSVQEQNAAPAPAPAPEPSPKTEPEAVDSDWKKDLYEEPEKAQEPADPEDIVPSEYNFDDITQTSKGTQLSGEDKSLVTDIAKKLHLSTKQAKMLLSEGGEIMSQHRTKALDDMAKNWFNQVKTDPDLGGKNFEHTQSNIRKAMKQYGSKELMSILETTRLGSHPVIVKLLNDVGRDLSEESNFVGASGPGKKQNNGLRSFYDNSPNLNF